MNLDPAVRHALAQDVLAHLERATPGSTARLRGSLAAGHADPYSDIDVFWEVPDDRFRESVHALAAALAQTRPVRSLRMDPDFQRSDKRALAFVQLEGVPLFWRVDIAIFAKSIRGDRTYDADNPAAKGTDWSVTHSALMNAIAAIRASLRGRDEEAAQLLARAFARLGIAVPESPLRKRVATLTGAVAAMDPPLAELAREIETLCVNGFKGVARRQAPGPPLEHASPTSAPVRTEGKTQH